MRRSEMVFEVEGSVATSAQAITLTEAGLYERQHLQEWILANPEILGDDVMVITSEFDRWASVGGREQDRLDILGLGSDGRLVVAELKRDSAPDFVALQAIKYAAMASRFELDQLARAYIDFHSGEEGSPATVDEALAALTAHAPNLSSDTIKRPRIMLIAGDFPTSLTSSVVWLEEQGLKFTLVRVQAYALQGRHVITVSQEWPTPEAEEFVIAPARAERTAKQAVGLPPAEWTAEDLQRLADTINSETILTTLDLCSQRPGVWVRGDEIMAQTGRDKNVHRGDFGGFAVTLQRRFDRSNTPYDSYYGDSVAGWQQHYSLEPELAAAWRAARGLPEPLPTAPGRDEMDHDADS